MCECTLTADGMSEPSSRPACLMAAALTAVAGPELKGSVMR